MPNAPDWLTPEARTCWDRIVPELAKLGLVSALDEEMLIAYVCEWAIYQNTIKELTTAAACVTKTSNGTDVQRVLVGVRNKALANLRDRGGVRIQPQQQNAAARPPGGAGSRTIGETHQGGSQPCKDRKMTLKRRCGIFANSRTASGN